VSDPANCSALLAETPPDPPGTAGTNLPPESGRQLQRRNMCRYNPINRRCSLAVFRMQVCAFRTFANPTHAKEIGIGKPGAVADEGPSSSVAGQLASIEPWIRCSLGALVVAGKGKGNGNVNGGQCGRTEPSWSWTVSDGHGFQIPALHGQSRR